MLCNKILIIHTAKTILKLSEKLILFISNKVFVKEIILLYFTKKCFCTVIAAFWKGLKFKRYKQNAI